MLARPSYLDAIQERFLDYPIVALPGPRQAGKTTLARRFVETWTDGPVHFFDLEAPLDRRELENPHSTLEALTGLVVLDEVQQMPELFPVLRVLADRPEQPAQFLILGSASPELVKGAGESLAGRVSFVDVTGFNIRETGEEALAERWWRGGFPRAFLARSDKASRQWQQDFFRTFLERDIPQLGIKIPSSALRRFWSMIAHSHGQIWNASEIGRSLGVSDPTTRRYLDILSGTYVVRQLQPWFENLKKRQVKSPKVYVRDSGLLHALLEVGSAKQLYRHPKYGASWEGFCIEQILSVSDTLDAYFWATHSGAELDLLIFHQGQRIGFEFKTSEAPSTTKSMHIALADLALDHLYVVYPGERKFVLTDKITAIPLLGALTVLVD